MPEVFFAGRAGFAGVIVEAAIVVVVEEGMRGRRRRGYAGRGELLGCPKFCWRGRFGAADDAGLHEFMRMDDSAFSITTRKV